MLSCPHCGTIGGFDDVAALARHLVAWHERTERAAEQEAREIAARQDPEGPAC